MVEPLFVWTVLSTVGLMKMSARSWIGISPPDAVPAVSDRASLDRRDKCMKNQSVRQLTVRMIRFSAGKLDAVDIRPFTAQPVEGLIQVLLTNSHDALRACQRQQQELQCHQRSFV